MRFDIRFLLVITAVTAVLIVGPARADQGGLVIGSIARSAGMAGAGIAIDDSAADDYRNPALLAGRRGVGFSGSGGVNQYTGPSLSEIVSNYNAFSNSTNGDQSASNAVDLANLFANHTGETNLDLGLNLGVSVGPLAVRGLAQGAVVGRQYYGPVPDDPSGTIGAPDPNRPGTSTVYETSAGYAYGPVFSGGMLIHNPISRALPPLKLGTNISILTGRSFTRYISVPRNASGDINTNPLAGPTPAFVGSQKDPSAKTSVGVDLAAMISPVHNVSTALVITNLVPPSLPGIAEQTVVTAGAAYKMPELHLLVAADLDNITSAYGESPSIRTGVEWKPLGFVALRGGVSSQEVSVGVGLFGLDVAYSFTSHDIQANLLHVGI